MIRALAGDLTPSSTPCMPSQNLVLHPFTGGHFSDGRISFFFCFLHLSLRSARTGTWSVFIFGHIPSTWKSAWSTASVPLFCEFILNPLHHLIPGSHPRGDPSWPSVTLSHWLRLWPPRLGPHPEAGGPGWTLPRSRAWLKGLAARRRGQSRGFGAGG